MPPKLEPLPPSLSRTLAHHEAIIAKGLKSFLAVGTALLAIREGQLYRATHPTFEKYCQERWELTSKRAYAITSAAEVVRALPEISDIPPPSRESHAAALAPLKALERASAWKEAREAAPDGKVTARHVKAAVAKRLTSTPVAPIGPRSLSDAVAHLTDVVRGEFAWWPPEQRGAMADILDRLADELRDNGYLREPGPAPEGGPRPWPLQGHFTDERSPFYEWSSRSIGPVYPRRSRSESA